MEYYTGMLFLVGHPTEHSKIHKLKEADNKSNWPS
jgi:hypothetical protein